MTRRENQMYSPNSLLLGYRRDRIIEISPTSLKWSSYHNLIARKFILFPEWKRRQPLYSREIRQKPSAFLPNHNNSDMSRTRETSAKCSPVPAPRSHRSTRPTRSAHQRISGQASPSPPRGSSAQYFVP